MKSIFERVNIQQKLNLPFVIYRKPNSKTFTGVFQENDHLYFCENLNEKGFVFAPFSGVPIYFPLHKSEVKYNSVYFDQNIIIPDIEEKLNSEVGKNEFTNLVKDAVEVIQQGIFEKIVLSRKEEILVPDFNLESTFQKILYQYTNAFCYCWYHPKIGMWMGATPETLFKANESKFETMSLAGTQVFNPDKDIIWKAKERKEQEFVTRYIISKLKNEVSDIQFSDPYTSQAGNLVHLRSDIVGNLKPEATLKKIISILHPTPAVCGLPKDLAKAYIETTEGYNREFYTGFLGELMHDFNTNENQTNLYVNLRCMKINMNIIQLFIGCGITAKSDPELEWMETVNKSLTMKKMLQ
jgi:isochorismate synthase